MLKLDIDTRPKIHYMDISTHRMVATGYMGDYASVFKGRGVIFESYREYAPTDDAGLIDWKASMRGGKPLVREFIEERNLDVFFLMDVSHTMVSGSQKKLKHELAAEMVSSMAFAILDHGNSAGLGMFSDRVRGFLMPERGVAQFRRIVNELVNPAHYDYPCDFEAAIRFCINRLPPATLIVVITDGINIGGGWERLLKVANRKFEVLAIFVRDPRDDELPQGTGHIVVENPADGRQYLIDADAVREDYARAARELKENSMAMMRRSHIPDVPVVRTDQEFALEVMKFFERRKSRWG